MCSGHNMTLELQMDERVGEVKLDVALFEQVLVNILENAVESMEGTGTIIVRTSLPATIEVIDNGLGIAKETEV